MAKPMRDQKIEPAIQNEKSNTGKWGEALRFFPSELRQALASLPSNLQAMVIEIRLRVNQPLELNFGLNHKMVTPSGNLTTDCKQALITGPDDLRKVFNSFTSCSVYALEDEVAQGYLALPGGYRVGVTGQVLYRGERIKAIRNISSLNFRIARSVIGIARPILPILWEKGRFLKTLILGPPASGKTTLLREIIREVSTGIPTLGISGIHVGLVDERSEIAGSYRGIPQLDIGPRTDVLDGCSKRDGVYLLLRAMNPQLIATDEIGREEDFQVVEDIINAGVSFIATAHARNLSEAMLRPGLKRILETGTIERLVFISNRLGAGTIESVKAGIGGAELFASERRAGLNNDQTQRRNNGDHSMLHRRVHFGGAFN